MVGSVSEITFDITDMYVAVVAWYMTPEPYNHYIEPL